MKKLTLLLLLAPLLSFGQDSASLKSTDWKTVEDSRFTVKHPASWDVDETGQMGTTIILMSPMESDEDKFRENFNFMIQDLKALNMDVNLDQYTQMSLEQIGNYITDSKVIENKRIKDAKGEYQRVEYTGDASGFHLHFLQHYWVKDGKAYLVTFTTEQSKWAEFKATGERILNSFNLKK